MTLLNSAALPDTLAIRKARGAFFTPAPITDFVAQWAIRSAEDRVLEPSSGDAEFLVSAVRRLRDLGSDSSMVPRVDGVEIHEESAEAGRQRVILAGGNPAIQCGDFFSVIPTPTYDAVIGNPPYIRYQDFYGPARTRSREAALRAGVALSGLASSWAAFTVQSASHLRQGGRLGLVLPAELLSVNYAAPVREFLFKAFSDVQLVSFSEQVFPEAEADVVLLMAEGYGLGPTDHATFQQARNAAGLGELSGGVKWAPANPATKWTSSSVAPEARELLTTFISDGQFTVLEDWGDTSLGMVTGNNRYFTFSPARLAELGIPENEVLALSPPGSSHLRGLSLTQERLGELGDLGKATWLFRPEGKLSQAAADYVQAGETAGVNGAYKCRVRKVWYEVPVMPPADLLLTYMNADTARLTTNEAGALHLNSVHGVYLREQWRELGRDLLPLASLNSLTLLHAEMVGRSYGGGILKIEPREADLWAMPSPSLIASVGKHLWSLKGQVRLLLEKEGLMAAVDQIDQVLLVDTGMLDARELKLIREAHTTMSQKRSVRGASG